MNPDLSDVVRFYESVDEANRLERGRHRLEAARVREIVEQRLPPPPAAVLDVGGAGGFHAAWLAEAGYDVHLIDPVQAHVDRAEAHARSLSRPFTAALGQAAELPRPDGTVEAVLLFGPLYHLLRRSDRVQAWAEARRVLRPGGVAFGIVISAFAARLDTLFRPPDIRTPGFVPTSYFHYPAEARAECHEAGLDPETIVGVEGPGWLLADFDARWEEKAERNAILDAARDWEHEESLLGLSAHLMVTGVKQLP